MRRLCCLLLASLPLAACEREASSNGAVAPHKSQVEQVAGGAISSAPIVMEPSSIPSSTASLPEPASRGEIDWAPLQLEQGTLHVSCSLDYQQQENLPLADFGKEGVRLALMPCVGLRLVRIRYQGKIDRGFVAVMERITVTADEMGIARRVLDLDSPGGLIEDAIRGGDFIAESHWTIWIREGAICHSACVLILGAGDMRMIAGKVGIHRIIRLSSTASSRAELNAELNTVYRRVREYLERNGVAVAVADRMMAVPNRRLRLLTSDELQLYGLDGVNPVQDDLDRLRLMRKCGEDFVGRRDQFLRAFERRCQPESDELGTLNECGLELRTKFGFPDSVCSAESPLSEFDPVAAANMNERPGERGAPAPPVSSEQASSEITR